MTVNTVTFNSISTAEALSPKNHAKCEGWAKGKLRVLEQQLLDKPWKQVRDGVEVKLSQDPQELWVLARSAGRQDKEMAVRRRKLRRLFQGLLALRRSLPKRDQLLQRIGVLRHEAGRAAALVCTHGHLTDAYAATRCGSDASRGIGATCGDKDDRCASSGQ